MLRFFNIYFPSRTVALLLVDVLLLIGAALLAPVVRLISDPVDIYDLAYKGSVMRFLLAPITCLLCLYYYDLYESPAMRNRTEIYPRLAQALGATSILGGLAFYAAPPLRLARGVFLIWLILVALSLWAWRETFFHLSHSARLAQYVLLLGNNGLAAELAGLIAMRPELGVRLAGTIEITGVTPHEGPWIAPDIHSLLNAIQATGARRLILTEPLGGMDINSIYELKREGLALEDGEALFEAITGRVRLNPEALAGLVLADGRNASIWLPIQRATSILASAVGLLVAAPLMLLITAAIKLESRGPAIFRQVRVGKDGRFFTLYKFRTMTHQPEDTEAPAQKSDDRFTRVGRWLRRTRLDELPQLFNILRGDMNFVGPRPFAAKQEEDLARRIQGYTLRWAVKPGISGWAQVCRDYCATLEDNIEKLSYDLYYIKHWSVGFDGYIIFKTLKTLLLGRGSR